MAASPRSTVSSDLYSPSEPAQSKFHPHGGPFQEDVRQASFDDVHINPEEPGYSDTKQRLGLPGEDISRPSSAAADVTTNGTPPETGHKRKRDQDLESEQAAEVYTNIRSDAEGKPLPRRTSSYGFLNGSPAKCQTRGTPDNLSRGKRPKTNEQTPVPSLEANLFSKVPALPAALWQYIFCFVPPVFLGHLLFVNRAFKSYLTPGEETREPATLTRSAVQPIPAEAIWVASRRRFAPGLPRPIHGLQELIMWRLLIGRNCQRCGHVGDIVPATPAENPWESGPGTSGVRVVWPFAVRCCGSCLQDVSKKELDLYLSAECPSFLLQAVPFAFVSKDNHYIGHNLLRNHTSPPSIPLTKNFPKPAIEEIMRKFEDVKTLGPASVEEWIKGLACQGQERLEDIIRWEQWESKGGLKKVNSRPAPKPTPAGVVAIGRKSILVKDDSNSDRSTPLSTVASTRCCQTSPGDSLPMEYAQFASDSEMKAPTQPAWSVAAHCPLGTHEGLQTPTYQPRPERNIRDVNGAKAARRAEIERRCAAMDPPLLSNVLNHMESFQAAMQITQPMTDQAWQILKPRLLAQVPYAERKEKERVQQNELLEEDYKQRRHQEAQLKETKESLDREWETFQNPVRNRLGALADEVIESRWAGGTGLTKDISPRFAADVLLNVRQRFYAEIAREDEAAVAAGENVITEPPNGPPTRTLILENMKWLFDTKIKPLTDHFQRELFLCNGCDSNFKFYGFEGVIQHYAAKHTTTLSMGNIVVHWRAEWPEHPPFNPNPSASKSVYYRVPTPTNTVHASTARDSQGPTSFGGFSQSGGTGPLTGPQRQEGSHHSADTYRAPHTGNSQEKHPAIPGQPYLSQATYGVGGGYAGASYNPYTATQQPQISQLYNSSYSNQQPYPAISQGQPAINPPSCFPGLSNNTYGGGQPVPVPYQRNFSKGVLPSHAPNNPGPVSDLYQRQMDDMAKHAKDVFTSIGGVKDLPGSVRIYIVIQLTVSRFKANFPNEPSLSMFIDGLDHNPTMRPVRSVNGLGCKTCMSSGTGAKLFTLPHLVNHFRTVHVECPQMLGHPQMPELDWKIDMIDLPDASIISKLVNAAGMTDSKLGLIASVLPGLFPSPLPSLRVRTYTGPLPTFKKEPDVSFTGASKMPTKIMADTPNQSVNPSKGQVDSCLYSGFRPLSRVPSSELLEPPGEDEYDPHRPALLGQVGKAGANSTQSYRPAKPSTQLNGRGSSFQFQHEPNRHMLPRLDNEQLFARTNVTSSNSGDRYPGMTHAQAQDATHPPTPRSDLIPQPKGQLDIGFDEQSMSQHHDKFNGFDTSIGYNARHRRILENGSIGPNSTFAECGARSASPQKVADAADHFLSSLAPNASPRHSGEPPPLNGEIERRSQASWQQGEPQPKRRQKYVGPDGAFDQWSTYGATVTRSVIKSPIDHLRTKPSEPQTGRQTTALHKTESGTHYLEDYRPPSQVQIPFNSLRADGSPIARYDSPQGVVQKRQEMAGSVLKRPRSGSHTYAWTHMSQYRPTSRSPSEMPADTALYRPRSPVEEDRGDPVFHARSPSSLRYDRPQRLVSYEYPLQARYEYIDEHGLREPQSQRVEYVRVPVEYAEPRFREAPARYFVSRPVEQLEPEYVRYEQSYVDEPVIQRNDQIYHASQRPYQEQPSRAAPSFSSSYQY